MLNPNRIISEIGLVSTHFGRVEFDEGNPSHILIRKLDLPAGFNRRYTKALLDLGEEYPIYPVKDFYIDRGLRFRGIKPDHYYETDCDGKPYFNSAMAWYSLHLKNWHPNPYTILDGDNLLTACEALYNALKTS